MSRNELVEAYAQGRVNRRLFMKGLVALGVSAGAAVAYADAIGAAGKPPGTPGGKPSTVPVGPPDLYDLYDFYDGPGRGRGPKRPPGPPAR